MKILQNNLIDNSTLTESSARDGYEVDNLKDYHLSKKFAFDTNSGNIVFTFTTATSVENFFLFDCNYDSGTVITLEGNSSDSWGSPAFSTTLSKYSNKTAGAQDLGVSYQYYRLVFPTVSGATNLALGYVYLGGSLQFPPMNPDIELNNTNSTGVSISASGQSFADTGINYFSTKFVFPSITDYAREIDGKIIVTRAEILEFWYDNQGATPIVMLIFEKDLLTVPPYLGIIAQNNMAFKFDRTQGFYSMEMNFLETK